MRNLEKSPQEIRNEEVLQLLERIKQIAEDAEDSERAIIGETVILCGHIITNNLKKEN